MDIKTKFNIGQTVFRMHDNTVQASEIVAIYSHTAGAGSQQSTTYISYRLKDIAKVISESLLFHSKEELLASL